MRFPDIDIDKLNLLMEFLINFGETHGPVYVRWSSETSEDQSYRFFPLKTAQADGVFTMDVKQFKIGGRIASTGC